MTRTHTPPHPLSASLSFLMEISPVSVYWKMMFMILRFHWIRTYEALVVQDAGVKVCCSNCSSLVLDVTSAISHCLFHPRQLEARVSRTLEMWVTSFSSTLLSVNTSLTVCCLNLWRLHLNSGAI